MNGINTFKNLISRKIATLIWVLDLSDVEGNENTDVLAKGGTKFEFIKPKPFLGNARSTMNISVQICEWNRNDICTFKGLTIIPTLSFRYFHENKDMPAIHMALRFCSENKDEFAEHILCVCSALEKTSPDL